MAASSSGEGFWFSEPVRRHGHHYEEDPSAGMDGLMLMEDLEQEGYPEDGVGGEESFYHPYAYGDPNGINWKERCLELEMSLQRFRDQAGKIRGLLREKVNKNAI